jgi:hypothetical protein
MMDWLAIGKMIAPMAPTIGGVLGDLFPVPMGGVIGRGVGQMLADALGVENTPQAVSAAIQNDPNAVSKITAAENEAAAKWPALAEIAKAKFASNAAQGAEINSTIRTEVAKGQPWFAWRNIYGYSVAFECTATSWLVLYAIAADPNMFKAVTDSMSFFLSWYALRMGLLGYIHNQSSNEKIAAATGQQPPGMVASIVKAVKGK